MLYWHHNTVHLILKFSCPNKYRGDECQELLESFKKRELKSLISQAQNSQCNNFQKRCLNLITDSVLAKMYKKSDKEKKGITKIYHTCSIWQEQKEFIHLNSILHENDIANCLQKVCWKMRLHQLYVVILILSQIKF